MPQGESPPPGARSMLCLILLHPAMSCPAQSCHALPCLAPSCLAKPSHAEPRTIPCHVLPHQALPGHAAPHHTVNHAESCHVSPGLAMPSQEPCRVLPCRKPRHAPPPKLIRNLFRGLLGIPIKDRTPHKHRQEQRDPHSEGAVQNP